MKASEEHLSLSYFFFLWSCQCGNKTMIHNNAQRTAQYFKGALRNTKTWLLQLTPTEVSVEFKYPAQLVNT